jgi:hypothetical protein
MISRAKKHDRRNRPRQTMPGSTEIFVDFLSGRAAPECESLAYWRGAHFDGTQ